MAQSERRPADDAAAKTKQSIDHDLQKLVDPMRDRIGEHAEALLYLASRRRDEGRERDRIRVPPWWYLLVLLLVGVVEWMLNYSAFQDNFGVPAVAGGLTILVAAMVAFASHEHGSSVKQWRMRFRQSGDQGVLGNWFFFGLATLGLIVSLALVAWVRYTWVEGLIGRGLDDLAILPKVLQTLGGNLIVWLLGAMVAFSTHDTSPKLQSYERARNKSKKRLVKAKKKLSLAIITQRQRYESEGDEKSEAARNATNDAIKKVESRLADLDPEVQGDVLDIADFSHLKSLRDVEGEQ